MAGWLAGWLGERRRRGWPASIPLLSSRLLTVCSCPCPPVPLPLPLPPCHSAPAPAPLPLPPCPCPPDPLTLPLPPGCTLASAIASYLARGLPLLHAVTAAREYLLQALAASASLTLGSGRQVWLGGRVGGGQEALDTHLMVWWMGGGGGWILT